jgi:hypothetical protein
MASPELPTRSVLVPSRPVPKMNTKIVKRYKPSLGPRKPPRQPGTKYRYGLFKATIPESSDLMPMHVQNLLFSLQKLTYSSAKANAVQSPLLSLPPEIRNEIWEYAVGHHQIDIHNYSRIQRWDIKLTHISRPLNKGPNASSSFVAPTFAVHKVCRQMYAEASAMIYTLNNFGFDNFDTFDRWILNRAPGQMRLVVSLNIPFGYYSLYRDGFRKLLRQTFPGITRVGLHITMAEMNQRVIPGTWFHTVPIKESLENVKKRFVDEVKKKEGENLNVDWYNGFSNPLVYLHHCLNH